ncbi:MAG TPA: glycosyltransferase [Anaerolineae bacterium]|nr:hypothetical protein [Anaerolineaceae bacterium]HRV96128.1 glycosyltransferase [Anaerolineae bacterium]
MIFVAVGTTSFDTLIKAVDELCLNWSEKVVMQIGTGSYEPKNCDYFRFAPSLTPYYEQASVVISHGGVGITTEVLQFPRPLVAVEDVTHPERHQQEILIALSQAKNLVWCQNLQTLPAAIEQARTQLDPYVKPDCYIHTVVDQFIERIM